MKEYKPFKSGKVSWIVWFGRQLIMVCTDRISAFDNILENPIPKKGEVLNKMSKFWFDFTKTWYRTIWFLLTQRICLCFPKTRIWWKQHENPKAGDDSCRMHRPGIHHRLRLGKLQKKTAPSAVSVCRKGLRNVKSSLKRFSLLLPSACRWAWHEYFHGRRRGMDRKDFPGKREGIHGKASWT